MQKIDQQKAKKIVGGAMGCVQVYNKSLSSDGKVTCNVTVACEDKYGNTTTSSKLVDMSYCA